MKIRDGLISIFLSDGEQQWAVARDCRVHGHKDLIMGQSRLQANRTGADLVVVRQIRLAKMDAIWWWKVRFRDTEL